VGMYSLQESKSFAPLGGVGTGGKTNSTESLPWRLIGDANDALTVRVVDFVNALLGYSSVERRARRAAREALLVNSPRRAVTMLDTDRLALRLVMTRKQESEQIIPMMEAGILRYPDGAEMLARRLGEGPERFHLDRPRPVNFVAKDPNKAAKK